AKVVHTIGRDDHILGDRAGVIAEEVRGDFLQDEEVRLGPNVHVHDLVTGVVDAVADGLRLSRRRADHQGGKEDRGRKKESGLLSFHKRLPMHRDIMVEEQSPAPPLKTRHPEQVPL
ncbi:MAG: hypothetical protein JSU68_05345, partial [Phycisphaerales bacterium]